MSFNVTSNSRRRGNELAKINVMRLHSAAIPIQNCLKVIIFKWLLNISKCFMSYRTSLYEGCAYDIRVIMNRNLSRTSIPPNHHKIDT